MTTKKPSDPAPIESSKPLTVGIVMPISPIEDCSADHWIEVKTIIGEAIQSINEYECEFKIVSENDAVGLIHQNIVQGLYNSDVVVCDVSCKNANVMFELGMRLAFDKPTIIIKDDHTSYSFDTSGIEHIEYPRDLRFSKIVAFKESLANKIRLTYEYSQLHPDHSPFLKAFGQFTSITPSQNQIPAEQYIVETLKGLSNDLSVLKRKMNQLPSNEFKTEPKNSSVSFNEVNRAIEIYIKDFLLRTTMPDISLKDIVDYVHRNLMEIQGIAFAKVFVKDMVIKRLTQEKIEFLDDFVE